MPRNRPTVRAALSGARAGLRRARSFPSTDKSTRQAMRNGRGDARRGPLQPARSRRTGGRSVFRL
ncbi:hypothetical protein C7S16_6270 [Burkholderia thailandensis]|uniref:Uncharacterized protein n=1 Tax=Burkholderia thailandensis TaxID=57975 RepID=A0AAW9CIX5_BURTH|nr:hypothetical protein [Burkholderia thailandensis]MDW9250718.1 hypothetical protein [Burkholderia thailandensis]